MESPGTGTTGARHAMSAPDPARRTTPDIVAEQIDKLVRLFPECVTEDAGGSRRIDFDRLGQPSATSTRSPAAMPTPLPGPASRRPSARSRPPAPPSTHLSIHDSLAPKEIDALPLDAEIGFICQDAGHTSPVGMKRSRWDNATRFRP